MGRNMKQISCRRVVYSARLAQKSHCVLRYAESVVTVASIVTSVSLPTRSETSNASVAIGLAKGRRVVARGTIACSFQVQEDPNLAA